MGERAQLRNAPAAGGQVEKLSWPRRPRRGGQCGWSQVQALEPREACSKKHGMTHRDECRTEAELAKDSRCAQDSTTWRLLVTLKRGAAVRW